MIAKASQWDLLHQRILDLTIQLRDADADHLEVDYPGDATLLELAALHGAGVDRAVQEIAEDWKIPEWLSLGQRVLLMQRFAVAQRFLGVLHLGLDAGLVQDSPSRQQRKLFQWLLCTAVGKLQPHLASWEGDDNSEPPS